MATFLDGENPRHWEVDDRPEENPGLEFVSKNGKFIDIGVCSGTCQGNKVTHSLYSQVIQRTGFEVDGLPLGQHQGTYMSQMGHSL